MRRVRCYDNGGLTADRYTVVWLKPFKAMGQKYWVVASMSEEPQHPLGVWGTTEMSHCPDVEGEHNKRIPFRKLPERCQQLVKDFGREDWP